MYIKMTVATQAAYIALAEAGKLQVGQYVHIEEIGRNVRYGGVRTEGGALTFWTVKGMSAAQFSKTVKAMTRKLLPVPAKVVPFERSNKTIILLAALKDIVRRGWFVTPASYAPSRDVGHILELAQGRGFEMKLTVTDSGGREIGTIQITDGRDHEIFGTRSPSLDPVLYRAFGLINEAKDYGQLSWAA